MELIKCTKCCCFQNHSHQHCSRCGATLHKGGKKNVIFFGTLFVTASLVAAHIWGMNVLFPL